MFERYFQKKFSRNQCLQKAGGREKNLTYLRGCWVHVGSHFGIATDELAWDGYIALVTRLHTKPGKKEHGGGNGEGRRKSPALGNILR